MNDPAQEHKSPAPQSPVEIPAEAPVQITVCVIAYNSGPTLRACLQHLADQTYRDFETLVIDNASPDPGDRRVSPSMA